MMFAGVEPGERIPYPDYKTTITILATRLWGSDDYSVVVGDAGEDGYFFRLNKGAKTMAASGAGLGEEESYKQIRDHLLAHLRARIDGDKSMIAMVTGATKQLREIELRAELEAASEKSREARSAVYVAESASQNAWDAEEAARMKLRAYLADRKRAADAVVEKE